MPVENIHADGSIMYNMPIAGAEGLQECHWSLFGDIHDDSELPADIVSSAKNGDEKLWRYLTPSQAKTRKNHRLELAALERGEEFEIEEEPAEGSVKTKA